MGIDRIEDSAGVTKRYGEWRVVVVMMMMIIKTLL